MVKAVSIIFHCVRWDAHLERLSLSTSALWSLDRAQIINISLHHGRGLHKSQQAAQNKKLLVPSAATKIYTGLPSWEKNFPKNLCRGRARAKPNIPTAKIRCKVRWLKLKRKIEKTIISYNLSTFFAMIIFYFKPAKKHFCHQAVRTKSCRSGLTAS